MPEVEKAMEDAAARELGVLRSRVRPLTVLSSVGPLVGLLGTAVGMILVFRTASEVGPGKAELLAEGIYLKLETTVAGLIVAIPSVLFAAVFNSRSEKLLRRDGRAPDGNDPLLRPHGAKQPADRPRWAWSQLGSVHVRTEERPMRLPPTEPDLGIPNMMPLIDVVFLLLIFFLMASRFEQEERELKVVLPEVAEAQPLAMTQELVINITPEGKYLVAQQQYSEEQLAALLEQTRRNNPHQSVLIRGDGRAAWKYGVRVMGLCNKAKIDNYRVAAIQEK